MTFAEFQHQMTSFRAAADEDAKALKDPYVTIKKLLTLYRKFDGSERKMADEVIANWALSAAEGVRFDGLALINELRIKTAIPALNVLAERLAVSAEPSAPYELEKVYRILGALESDGDTGRAR